MQRPVGEDSTPKYRHGPPAPVAPLQGPKMMAIGRSYRSPPAVQGRGPMMPPHPPFSPGGQQSHRFRPPPPPPMMAPGNAMTPPPRQAIASVPPPPPPSMLTSSSAAVPHPSMPPPPPPPVMVRAAGMIPLGQHQPLPPGGGSPTPLSLNSCPPPQLPQGSTLLAHTATALPEPPKPKDDEVIRNIEVLTQFVVKNGSEFESMAQAKQAGNPKFSFLFGGEAGSDAAIGQEYYQWLKKKCQLEKSVGREVEAKLQPAVPSISVGYNQHQKDSNAVSSDGPLPASDASDMEMDMDMEDDIAVPKSVNDDAKDFETTDRKGEHHLTVSNHKAECIETSDCQVTSLVNAGGKHFEASQLEFQKEKGKIVSALEPPCVEDVSPVRPLPKELQQNLIVEKSEVKSFFTVCGPPVASTSMAESKCTESSHVIEAGSEIAGFRENKSVQSISHGDMECKKLEGVGHCFNIKSLTYGLFSKNFKDMFDSANNNISSDLDNMKSNIALTTDSVKPNSALVSDNLISEVGLHGKLEELPRKVDKYGRVIRKSGSDSESNDTKEVMDPSWSRSPSPRYERRRKRSYSNSPRRKSRWSRSHSRTPKRRRSRSRTPLHDFRRGGDLRYDRISRRRGTTPLCNDFAKGRCYRGASCRFLHEEISGDDVNRWAGGRRTKERSDSRQDTTMSVGAKDGLFFGELDRSKSISPDKYFDGHDNRNLGERRNQDFEGQNSRNVGERKNQLFDVHDNLDSGERKHHDFYDNHNFGERKNPNDGYDKCNFGERKNQEHYRSSDHSNNPCFNFLKGRCYRGLSCRYLHSETTTDNSGRWSGAGKGRERIENREDITKSYDGRDNFEAGEMKEPKIHSPIKLSDEHYKHNIGDRRIKEVDRNHGRSVPKCIFFARGVCQRGSSCRFLHEDVSGDNVGLKGRGRSKSRVDVHDIPDSVRQRSQEPEKHNDSSADIVVNPQVESPCREILQSRREELWASSLSTVDAPPQHIHKGNLEHLPSGECLNFKAVLEGNVGQPLVSEGSTAESFKQKLEPDDPVENSCLHSNVNSHLTPHQFLPQDLQSLQNHAVLDRSLMFRQVHGSAGVSLMSENDALRGTSPSQLNIEDKVDLLPRGSPTNSSTMYPHSGTIACSMSYECDSIASLPSLVPQPVSEVEHSKYGEVNHIANVSTDMVTDCTEKKSPCLQTSMEPVFHFTDSREEHPAPMSTTMSLLPMQNKSGQIASAPLVDHCANGFGKMATTSTDQISGYSHTSLESLSHVSNIGQDGVTQRTRTMPHFDSQNKSEQSASAFGEQKMGFFSNCAGSSTSSLSAIYEPIKDMPAGGDLNNHLSVSGERFSVSKDLSNKVSDSANIQDIKEIAGEPDKSILLNNASLVNKVSHVKPSSPSRIQNISGNEKNKDALESSLMETVLHQAVHGDSHAGSSMLENRSPACEGKKSNPGAGTEDAADIDTEQGHALDESKKSKEIKVIKQFRTVLAEFVKEELKPTWREGHMSKESFKTIVKKVVDKVAGSLQVHQMPKTQERIDQYIAASRSKLTKLIQGYVEKYVKS